MSGFNKFVSMARSPEEKDDAMDRMMGHPEVPDFPPGLTFCFDEVDLEKLDLEDDVEVGDLIHLNIMARVTSVSKKQIDGQDCCRIEMQGELVAVEDESTEDVGDDD